MSVGREAMRESVEVGVVGMYDLPVGGSDNRFALDVSLLGMRIVCQVRCGEIVFRTTQNNFVTCKV